MELKEAEKKYGKLPASIRYYQYYHDGKVFITQAGISKLKKKSKNPLLSEANILDILYKDLQSHVKYRKKTTQYLKERLTSKTYVERRGVNGAFNEGVDTVMNLLEIVMERYKKLVVTRES